MNNLYLKEDTLPDGLPVIETGKMVGDARFVGPGGIDVTDYTPNNRQAVRDRGVKIPKLPGDKIGLKDGLEVKADFFGNPIVGLPDLGAVEVGGKK